FSQARLAALALASPNSRKGVAFNAALNSYRNQSKALHFRRGILQRHSPQAKQFACWRLKVSG
ncbi:MAG TPA: hypothetical protein PLA03_04425, partial [Acidobacteriota bacterium]|nr:hypothetical protein [Acidobacteriota bacterium]